jgi:hypothetical protein
MPARNKFRHQQYPTAPSIRPQRHKLRTDDGKGVDFSKLHSKHGIHRVLLVHGTFLGDDPIGVSEILRRVGDSSTLLKKPLYSLAERISAATKKATASLSKDVANYCDAYQTAFQTLVVDDPTIQFMEPSWSSQNHHVARADLAVRLLVQLDKMIVHEDQRVLLWGHSHAGNGFAILTNLLANDRQAVQSFFDAAGDQGPHWQEAKAILANAPSPHPYAGSIDITAFGTPVRYGWDTTGYSKLIHVLHDLEPDPNRPNRTQPLFPPHSLSEMVSAKHGDWVQAFGIAGTDVPTGVSLMAHKRLAKVLTAGLDEPNHGPDTRFIVPATVRNACAWWKTGTRCHADGLNLLVEYNPCGRKTAMGQPIEQSVFGHGVATTVEWLSSHLTLVLNSLDANQE